ncbi:MAG: N-acetylneuraminic acid synthase [Crocinitomicaceae bacterium TMED209]|nr:MAG: hypothetical protein CBB97_00625 [Candidatus Endolissoclinum sp. TMED37]RPG88490.1 MAG: N-acetylneuraminic acid synthase [Crocinitomicaceae bacterium TMED209]|tara:strand:- start:971 stop:1852 length:882 start_codon:yes stop_codon:yes gene_type:complete
MKPYLIAEISSNHNGSLSRASDLVTMCGDIGFDAVKFQLFNIEKLFSPEILSNSKLHQGRKKWELPISFIPELSKRTRDLGMQFGCTPFYLEAVDELLPFVDFYKIASYEILWHDLIKKCCETEKNLMLSSGMASVSEIRKALSVISICKKPEVTIMKCTSSYPTKPIDLNLAAIQTLKEIGIEYSNLNIRVGLSDHSRSLPAILRAIHKYEVSAIEIHVDLDKKGVEFSSGHCWLPSEIKMLKKFIDEGIASDGENKLKPVENELSERDWRADPSDGLRPLKKIRRAFKNEQ